jgi:hypothetical protein
METVDTGRHASGAKDCRGINRTSLSVSTNPHRRQQRVRPHEAPRREIEGERPESRSVPRQVQFGGIWRQWLRPVCTPGGRERDHQRKSGARNR